MMSLSHYQKLVLIFMLLILVFSTKTKIHKIEDVQNKESLILEELLFDSKLWIHFVEDKTKCFFLLKLNIL